jgi:hypothetical protein
LRFRRDHRTAVYQTSLTAQAKYAPSDERNRRTKKIPSSRGILPLLATFSGWIIIICFTTSSFALAGDRDSVDLPLYNLVAVGRGRGQILLATLASPAEKLGWRYRNISISPPEETVANVILSTSGTKALIDFGDGSPRVFDLTRPITGISSGDAPPPQHRLLFAHFPYAANGEVCLLDDLGHSTASGCTKAVAAAIHEDGRVLYATDDGQLFVTPSGGLQHDLLPYHLPQGAAYRLLAGHRGDARDFLVLVTHPATGNGAGTHPLTSIIDPRMPATLIGEYANPTTAALRAQLAFSSGNSPPGAKGFPPLQDDATLETLAARLDSQTHTENLSWTFYRVSADSELYAPVLEFADGEPDYPSDVNFWEEIKPLSHGDSVEDYRAAYASMRDRRWSRCTYYTRIISYPGTWLIEYWFYYPFDEGKAHPHIHDSEHLFIEVDKLGGTVRNVFASDHDSFAPNNLYSTLVKNAPPVSIPLFAMAELGKHAMAPDLNHDGRFTRGIDDNLHIEPYSLWGLRDRSTKFHFMMEPYLASMSLPRTRDGRFALADAPELFPDLNVPAEHEVCRLQPFPEDPPCPNCEAATSAAAITHLVDHPDARTPENIYKPYVVPWRELRFGVGIFDWSEGRAELSLAYVGDFRHMTGGFFPIPARLGLEFGVTPIGRAISIPIAGEKQVIYSHRSIYAGVRVERLITNTQGFYFAVTPKFVDISVAAANGMTSPSPLHWQYGGPSYHAGYVLELPSAHKGNLTQHIGALIGASPYFPVLFEWRVSLGFLARRGSHEFGAKIDDRNPYQ